MSRSAAQAGSGRVVGFIASVAGQPGHSIALRARGSETRQIRTDAQTTYEKWITHKPLQLDSPATSGSLLVGR